MKELNQPVRITDRASSNKLTPKISFCLLLLLFFMPLFFDQVSSAIQESPTSSILSPPLPTAGREYFRPIRVSSVLLVVLFSILERGELDDDSSRVGGGREFECAPDFEKRGHRFNAPSPKA